MPYLGLTSFLPYRRSNIIISRRMCQCPISGSRHFYVLNKFQSGKVKVCVNALSRAHVISTASLRIQNDKEHACVNALSRAHVISTPIHVTLSKRKRRKVSMPYLGLTSFLLKARKKLCFGLGCQCPISGSRHFYALEYWNNTYNDIVCQCPISGSRHFYRQKK